MANNERDLLVILKEFQDAERRYSEAVNDLVKAEIRRDAAKRERDECYARLETARAKYSDRVSLDPPNHGKTRQGNAGERRQSERAVITGEKSKQEARESCCEEIKPAMAKNAASQRKSFQNVKQVRSNGRSTDQSVIKKSASERNEKPKLSQPQRESISSRPRFFKKLLTIEPLNGPIGVLDICEGRTREWLDKHLDCDSLGLVRNFYKASFGTRTNPETHMLVVSTILISDEWNSFAKTTADIQKLHIGTGSSSNNNGNVQNGVGKHQTYLRDKVAEVLSAPQTETIALFYAPKKKYSHIYYGGHWKVERGKKLDPPKMVTGQLRQCYLKLAFVGVNQTLVDAINENKK
jgi:hypothetical protein